MVHSYIAYIDESGDDGLPGHYRTPGVQGGASNFFSIGCVLWRLSRDLDAVGWAKEISAKMPPQKRNKTLHFKDMDHPQKVMAINGICARPMRLIAVISYKPHIPMGTYTCKNQFYHYMSRYLIERISWLCRDLRKSVPEGDGRVKIIFARRGGMNTDDFKNYMHLLKASHDPDIKIHWPVIDIDGMEAHDQPAKRGLQLADIAVSGLAWALEPDYYGGCEPRFARSLKPIVYHRNGNYMSYGTKMIPPHTQLDMTPEQLEFVKIYG